MGLHGWEWAKGLEVQALGAPQLVAVELTWDSSKLLEVLEWPALGAPPLGLGPPKPMATRAPTLG